MSEQQPQLPLGWEAHWNHAANRYLYIDRTANHSQWEEPTQPTSSALQNPSQTQQIQSNSPPPPPQNAAPAGGNPRRRQYPSAQLLQGYDNGGSQSGAGGGAFIPGQPQQQQQPAGYTAEEASGGYQQQQSQMFTPVVQPVGPSVLGAGVINNAMNYFSGATPSPATGSGGGGGAQQGGGYPGQGQGGYQGQGQGQGGFTNGAAGGVAGMTQQFGGMGMGEQKSIPQTLNLIGMQPNVQDLERAPPTPVLPLGASCTNSPTANAHYSYQRCTVTAMPTTSSIANKSKVPIAMVITPYKTLKEGEEPVPVVTDAVIARCRRCRTYINPFVTFIEGGARWKCCMCNLSNEVPQLFDWDSQTNQPADRWSRPELNHGVVEFIAPGEYLVRPPQPPIYVFVIDVSQQAIQSGMVATAARTILESLDRIPNADNRSKCAVIAVSSAMHFFTLPTGESEPSMLVVSDLEDVYLPMPNDLLINIVESRPALESLLNRLSDMFKDSNSVGSAMGPAMQAAHKLIASMGGKIMALTSTLPTLGDGALKARDDPKLLGSGKESSLLQSAASFYKSFAIECSKTQVTVDMFLFSSTYTDVASLRCLPRYTGGQVYYYPGFTASRSEDAIKFAAEFSTVLTSPICLEAVIRARTTRGIRLAEFHGNFFTRSTDLLSLPTISMDQSYAIELQIEDPLTQPFVVVQTGILHTTCFGERRIRVMTTAIPTTSNLSEVIGSVDQNALVTLLANKAVERAMTAKFEDARDAIFNKVVDILTVYKTQSTAAGSGASAALAVPENLKLLPLLACAMVKHVAFRESSQIPPDLRAYAHALLTTLPTQSLIPYLHARFYSLHNMPANVGTVGDEGLIMPTPMNLTSERLERHGLFLIEDSQTMFLWVGQEAVPQLIQDVFDLPNYAELKGGKYTLPLLDNPFSQRVNAVIAKSREMRSNPYWQHLYVVKADAEPALRNWALSLLIEDRVDRSSSYSQFLGLLKDKVNGSS